MTRAIWQGCKVPCDSRATTNRVPSVAVSNMSLKWSWSKWVFSKCQLGNKGSQQSSPKEVGWNSNVTQRFYDPIYWLLQCTHNNIGKAHTIPVWRTFQGMLWSWGRTIQLSTKPPLWSFWHLYLQGLQHPH